MAGWCFLSSEPTTLRVRWSEVRAVQFGREGLIVVVRGAHRGGIYFRPDEAPRTVLQAIQARIG